MSYEWSKLHKKCSQCAHHRHYFVSSVTHVKFHQSWTPWKANIKQKRHVYFFQIIAVFQSETVLICRGFCNRDWSLLLTLLLQGDWSHLRLLLSFSTYHRLFSADSLWWVWPVAATFICQNLGLLHTKWIYSLCGKCSNTGLAGVRFQIIQSDCRLYKKYYHTKILIVQSHTFVQLHQKTKIGPNLVFHEFGSITTTFKAL